MFVYFSDIAIYIFWCYNKDTRKTKAHQKTTPADPGRKDNIMATFKAIPGASGSIHDIGVRWASDTICVNPDVRREIGENHMGNYTDNLCSYDGPLYQGSDGKLYIVEWYYGGNEPVPACWMPVERTQG